MAKDGKTQQQQQPVNGAPTTTTTETSVASSSSSPPISRAITIPNEQQSIGISTTTTGGVAPRKDSTDSLSSPPPSITITVVPRRPVSPEILESRTHTLHLADDGTTFVKEPVDPLAEPDHEDTDPDTDSGDASDDWDRMSTVSMESLGPEEENDDAASIGGDDTLRVHLLPPEQKLTANKDSPYKPHPNTFLGRIRFYLQLPPTPPLYMTVEVFGLLILSYALVVGLGYYVHHHLPTLDRSILPSPDQMEFKEPPLPDLAYMKPEFNVTQALLTTAYLSQLGPHPYNSDVFKSKVRPFLVDYLNRLAHHADTLGRRLIISDDVEDPPAPLVVVDSKSTPYGLGTFFRPTNIAVRLLGARSMKRRLAGSILLTAHFDTPTLSPGSTSPSGMGLAALLEVLSTYITRNPLTDADLVFLFSSMGSPASHLNAPGSVAFRSLPHHFYPTTNFHIHLDNMPFSGFHCRPLLTHTEAKVFAETWQKTPFPYGFSPTILNLGTSGTAYEAFQDGEGKGAQIGLGDGGVDGTSGEGYHRVRPGGMLALGLDLVEFVRGLDGRGAGKPKDGLVVVEGEGGNGTMDWRRLKRRREAEQIVVVGPLASKGKTEGSFWTSKALVFHHFMGYSLWLYTASFYIWGMLGTLILMPLLGITAISLYAYFRQRATAYQVWQTIIAPFLTQTVEVLYSLLAKFGKLPTGFSAAEKFYRMLRSAGALFVGVVLTVLVGIIGISTVASLNPAIAYSFPELIFTYLVFSSIFCFSGALLLWERRDYVYQKAQLKRRIKLAQERAARGEDQDSDSDEDYDEEEAKPKKSKTKGGGGGGGGKKGKKGKGEEEADPDRPPLMMPGGTELLPAPALEPKMISKTLSVVGTRPLEQDRFNHLLQAVNVYWWGAVFGAFYVAASDQSALLYGVWLWALFYGLAAVIDYAVGFARLSELGQGWWKRLNWAVLIVPAFLIPGIPYVDYLLIVVDAVTSPLSSIVDYKLPEPYTLGWQFALLGSPLFVVAIPWMARAGRDLELSVITGSMAAILLIVACSVTVFKSDRPYRIEVYQEITFPVVTNGTIPSDPPTSILYLRPLTVGWQGFKKSIHQRFPEAVIGDKFWTIPNATLPDFWGEVEPPATAASRSAGIVDQSLDSSVPRLTNSSTLPRQPNPLAEPYRRPIRTDVHLDTKVDKKTRFITAYIHVHTSDILGICRASLRSVWSGKLSGKWRAVPTPYIPDGEVKAGCCAEWDIVGGPEPPTSAGQRRRRSLDRASSGRKVVITEGEDGMDQQFILEDSQSQSTTHHTAQLEIGKKPKPPPSDPGQPGKPPAPVPPPPTPPPPDTPDPPVPEDEWSFTLVVQFQDPINRTLPELPVATGTIECFLDSVERVPAVLDVGKRLPASSAMVGRGMGLVVVREQWAVFR